MPTVFVETAVMIETVLEHVSHKVHLEADVVRDLNMYDKGDITICGQHLADSNAKHVFHHLRVLFPLHGFFFFFFSLRFC